jgi:large subunit ribosomal protein L11
MGFVKEYNSRTANQSGTIIPVHLTVYEDRSFTFVTRTPPASELLRKAANVGKGSSDVRQGAVGSISRRALREIAEAKAVDLNASSVDEAMLIIAGTARSMGIEVSET